MHQLAIKCILDTNEKRYKSTFLFPYFLSFMLPMDCFEELRSFDPDGSPDPLLDYLDVEVHPL